MANVKLSYYMELLYNVETSIGLYKIQWEPPAENTFWTVDLIETINP